MVQLPTHNDRTLKVNVQSETHFLDRIDSSSWQGTLVKDLTIRIQFLFHRHVRFAFRFELMVD